MQFIKENELTIDYGKVIEMKKTIEREITTVEEYIQWVRDWRKINAALVGSIQYMRNVKNEIRDGVRTTNYPKERAINSAYETKLGLRPHAKRLYELRVDNKARFKAGEFGDPTFKKREIETIVAA